MVLESEGELYDLPQFQGFFGRVKLVAAFLYGLIVSHQFVARMAAFWGYGIFIASSLTLTIPQTEIPIDKTWSPVVYKYNDSEITADSIVETESSYGSDPPPVYLFSSAEDGFEFLKLMPDSAYLPALAVGNVIGGLLVDMFGSRRPIALSLLTTGAICLILGLLSTWYKLAHKATLIVLFMLGGLFCGTILPAIVELCGVWLMIGIRNPHKWVGMNMGVLVMTNRLGAMLHGMLIYPWIQYSFEVLYIVAGALCISFVPITYMGIISTPAKLEVSCREYPKVRRQALLKMNTPRCRNPLTLLKSCMDHRLFIYGIPLFLIGIPRYNSLNYMSNAFLWGTLFSVILLCNLSDWIGRAACGLLFLVPALIFNIVLALDSVLTQHQEHLFDQLYHGLILCVQMLLIACIPIDITLDYDIRNTGTLTGLIYGMFTLGNAVGAGIGNSIDINRKTTTDTEWAIAIGAISVACMLLSTRIVPDYKSIRFWRSIDYLGKYMRQQAAIKQANILREMAKSNDNTRSQIENDDTEETK